MFSTGLYTSISEGSVLWLIPHLGVIKIQDTVFFPPTSAFQSPAGCSDEPQVIPWEVSDLPRRVLVTARYNHVCVHGPLSAFCFQMFKHRLSYQILDKTWTLPPENTFLSHVKETKTACFFQAACGRQHRRTQHAAACEQTEQSFVSRGGERLNPAKAAWEGAWGRREPAWGCGSRSAHVSDDSTGVCAAACRQRGGRLLVWRTPRS